MPGMTMERIPLWWGGRWADGGGRPRARHAVTPPPHAVQRRHIGVGRHVQQPHASRRAVPSACHREGRICLQTAPMPFWSVPRLRKLHEIRAGLAHTIATGAPRCSVGALPGLPSFLLWAVLACLFLPLEVRADDAAAPWRPVFRRPTGSPPAPADNPMALDRIALGARLFADPRLSGSGERSCASCHRTELAFTDGRRRAKAVSGAPLRRNTPSLWN